MRNPIGAFDSSTAFAYVFLVFGVAALLSALVSRRLSLKARGRKDRDALRNVHFAELEETIRERDEQISERIRIEKALRETEQRLKYTIDFLPDATFVIDCDGRVVAWNHAMEAMTGTAASEMLGRSDYAYSEPFYGKRRPMLIDLVASPSRKFERHYTSLEKRADGVLVGEGYLSNPKLGEFYFMATAAVLYDQHGVRTGAIESIREITERKKAEVALKQAHDSMECTVEERTRELRAAKESAETANRAKSIFLSNMSHELRTPLNVILGYSQLLRRDGSIGPDQRESLETINRSGEHLLTLINDVLEISRIEAQRVDLELVSFDIGAMFKDIVSMFRLKADAKKLKLTLEGAETLPRYVLTDERKLRQILINLVANAIKFTEGGGVAIRASASNMSIGNRRLLVEVEDTGMGIASDEFEKVFQAFEQTASGKRVSGGTGLGMPISRKYAQMLGGDITLSSALQQGSLFRLDVIIREGDEPHPKKGTDRLRVAGLAPGQPVPRILVAEDVPESRILLARLLGIAGFEVREAVNGREAVEIAAEWRPHFVWMDVRMPVMNGMEATRIIKASEAGGSITIAALTAHSMLEDRRPIMTAGFDDFVSKPFREHEIFEVMAKHLGLEYLQENCPPADKAAARQPQESLLPQQLASLPQDLLDRLRHAVLTLDTAATMSAIRTITEQQPSLGGSLNNLALDLDYDRMLNLLEQ